MEGVAGKESRLLSYGSVVLDHGDLELLQDGQWLNDRLITFASEYLMNQLTDEERETMEVVCASACEMIKFSPDFTSFLSDYAGRQLVFFILNNNTDPTRPGGSHWSLLLYDREHNRFVYLDSLMSPDTRAAEKVACAAARFLCPEGSPPARLQVVACPKQENINDCGMLVIEFIRFILSHGRRSATKALDLLAVTKMDAAYVAKCRGNWRTVIVDQATSNRRRLNSSSPLPTASSR